MASSGIKRSRLAVALRAAMLLLAVLALGAVARADDKPGCSPVYAALEKQPGNWVAVDQMPASKAALVLGDGYTLEIRRGEAVQKCRGPLIQVTDDWVVLRQAVMSASIEGIPYLMDIPLVGRLFSRQNDSIAAENDVWIPRSTATIESHLKVTRHAAKMPHLPEAPPLNATCYVLVAAGDKVDSFPGVLTAVDDDEVTMLNRDDGSVLKIARQDFLSVSIEDTGPQHANGGADPREAKASNDSKRSE